MTLDERIALYLEKCPPAVAGSRGHDQTFAVACALVNGFALDETDALRHMLVYNATCSPSWKERELRHKVQQAAKVNHQKPRGHLLGMERKRLEPAGNSGRKPAPVSLEPQKGRFRTVRTLLSDPYTHTGVKDLRPTYIKGGDFVASEASERRVSVKSTPPANADGGREVPYPSPSVEHSLPDDGLVVVPGCRVKRPAEIEMADADWQKLDAAGFAAEPVVQLAAWMFGPCTVVSTGEASPCVF